MSITSIFVFFASIRNRMQRQREQYREFQRRQETSSLDPIRQAWQQSVNNRSTQQSVRYIFIPSVENTYQYQREEYETTVRSRRSFCGRYWCIICFILFITSIACIMTSFFRLKEIAETTTSVPNSTIDFTTESN